MDTSTNIAKQVYLNYFNQVLFEKGIITEDERNKMKLLIAKNCAVHPNSTKKKQELL